MTRDIGSESEVSDQLSSLRLFYAFFGASAGGMLGLMACLAAGIEGAQGILAWFLGLLFASVGWLSARQSNDIRARLAELSELLDEVALQERTEVEPRICLNCGEWLRPDVLFCTACGSTLIGGAGG